MQKLLKLNLPEIIQVSLPNQKQSIFGGIWLDNSDYLINKYQIFVKSRLPHVSNIWGEQRVLNVGKVGGKYDTLKVKYKQISHRGNNTNKGREITPCKEEVYAWSLKAANMSI